MHTEELPETTTPKELEEVESIIKAAMEKTKVLKEKDLAYYIPHGDTHLSFENFIKIKRSDKNSFSNLIKTHILQKTPIKIASSELPSTLTSSSPPNVLDILIRKAMQKLDAEKETEIGQYIPYENGRLHHHTFNKLKKNDPAKLSNLITSFILTKDPKKVIRKNRRLTHQSLSPLEQTIAEAMKRRSLKLKNEEDLCLYLPYIDSRMRSTRFQSMKNENPEQLRELIEHYVLKPKKPRIQERKRKANDLNNKQQSEVENIEPQKISQFDQLLEAIQESAHQTISLSEQSSSASQKEEAFQINNKLEELVNKMTQSIDLMTQILKTLLNLTLSNGKHVSIPSVQHNERVFQVIQNQLIKQIKHRKVDTDLWDTYLDLISY